MEDRDNTGKFTKGNSGGPGNPFAKQVSQLRSKLLAAITPEDLSEIIRKTIELAKNGDLAATKMVLSYAVGRPGAVADPAQLEADALRHEIEVERLHVQRKNDELFNQAMAVC